MRQYVSIAVSTLLGLLNVGPAAGSWSESRDAFQRGDFQAAVSLLEPFVGLHPEYAPGFCLLGMAQARLGTLDEAAVSLARGVELRAGDPSCRLALARVEAQRGRWVDAVSILGELATGELETQYRSQLGRLLAATAIRAEPSPETIEIVRRGLQTVPNEPDLWWALGHLEERAGDLSRAGAAYLESAERASDPQAFARGIRATYGLETTGSDDIVVRAARLAADRARPGSAADASLAGDGFMQARRWTNAALWYERALAQESTAETLYNLGACRVAAGEPAAAVPLLESALVTAGGNDRLRVAAGRELGRAHHHLRDYRAAAAAYEEVGATEEATAMIAAAEQDAVNARIDELESVCRRRKARYDALLEENRELAGTDVWTEIEREVAAGLADCQPYLTS